MAPRAVAADHSRCHPLAILAKTFRLRVLRGDDWSSRGGGGTAKDAMSAKVGKEKPLEPGGTKGEGTADGRGFTLMRRMFAD